MLTDVQRDSKTDITERQYDTRCVGGNVAVSLTAEKSVGWLGDRNSIRPIYNPLQQLQEIVSLISNDSS